MQRKFYILSIVVLVACAAFAISTTGGCATAADQSAIQSAATNLSALSGGITAAQTAVRDLQSQIAAQQTVIQNEHRVLATQPADATANKVLADTETAVVKTQTALDSVNAWLVKAKPVVDAAATAAATIQSGGTPNFGVLSAFGPYGMLAGMAATLGWGAYQNWQKNKGTATISTQAQQLAAQQPVIDHIQTATGTTNPVSAVAALTASAAMPSSQSETDKSTGV